MSHRLATNGWLRPGDSLARIVTHGFNSAPTSIDVNEPILTTPDATGVVLGLDVLLARKAGDWYGLVIPGAYIENGSEKWELGHCVSQFIGPNTGTNNVELRHWRDPRYPVRARDGATRIKTIGQSSTVTMIYMQAEGGMAAAYLPDSPPFYDLTVTIGGSALAAGSYTVHNNRVAVDAGYVGLPATISYNASGVLHCGLSAVTISGTWSGVYLDYRAMIPAGGVLPYHDLITWTVAGAMTGATVTQDSGDRTTLTYVPSDNKVHQYMLTAEVDVVQGQVRMGANNINSVVAGAGGRQLLAVACTGGTVNMYFTPVGSLAEYQVRGVYLVETVDPENRLTIGKIVDECYINNTPYTMAADTIVKSVNYPYCSTTYNSTGQRAPHRVKFVASGDVGGKRSLYGGPAGISASGATITAEETALPGTFWYSINTVNNTTSIFTVDNVSATVALDANYRMPVPHIGTQYICPYAEVVPHSVPDIYTIRPRIRNQWGDEVTSASVAVSFSVTVHLTGGQILEGTVDSSVSQIVISSSSVCTAMGGSKVQLEIQYGGHTYWSPPSRLPPEKTSGEPGTITPGLAVLPFCVDVKSSRIDDPRRGRVYM